MQTGPAGEPRRRGGIKEEFQRGAAQVRSRAVDWVLLIILAIIWGVVASRRNGFRRQFSLTDTSIQHPCVPCERITLLTRSYAEHERVPTYALMLISIVAPVVLIIVMSMPLRRSVLRTHNGILGTYTSFAPLADHAGLLITLVLTGVITNVVKLCAGRPRPDLLDRCQPRSGPPVTDPNTYHSKLFDDSICTTPHTSHRLADGFKSFPSGHASTVFAGMVFLALFVRDACNEFVACMLERHSQRMQDASSRYEGFSQDAPGLEPGQDTPGQVEPSRADNALLPEAGVPSKDTLWHPAMATTSVVLPMLLMTVASLVAVSRTMDYRHHATDVLSGAILGAVVGICMYHVYHHVLLPFYFLRAVE